MNYVAKIETQQMGHTTHKPQRISLSVSTDYEQKGFFYEN